MRTIIFVGYFTVGEKINSVQMTAVAHAKKLDGDLAIIVNDIDLSRKIRFYAVGGKEMLIRHYSKRIKCGGTQQLCELPGYEEIPSIIDWNFYDEAAELFRSHSGELSSLLSQSVVSPAVQKRVKEYGLSDRNISVVTERELRNRASKRISNVEKNSKRGWRKQLEKINLLSDVQTSHGTIPTCGGIMLAQFEKATQAGYQKMIQLDGEEERRAIENGIRIFEALHNSFPDDPRWKLLFETVYFKK